MAGDSNTSQQETWDMSSSELLVICRPASDPLKVQNSLEAAGWPLSNQRRVQGFGQAPGLLSGTNHLLLVSVNKHSSLEQALSGLLDWLKSREDPDVYVPESVEEHAATLAKLLPPTPLATPDASPVVPARPESDRKFTFEEPATSSTPLTRSAVEALPEALDEQLIHHDSLSRTTQSLSISEQSDSQAVDNLPACSVVQPRPSQEAPAASKMDVHGTDAHVQRRASNLSSQTCSSQGTDKAGSVKSSQSSSVQPRATRASTLRANGANTPLAGHSSPGGPRASTSRQSIGTSGRSTTTGNYPGYKRQSLDIHVASVADPAVKPRTNRAAALRAGTWTEADEEASKADREQRRRASVGSTANTPGYKRASLQLDVKSTRKPSIAPRMSRAAALRMGIALQSPKPTPEKKTESPLASKTNKRASFNVASLSSPIMAPRPNRAAELRASGQSGPSRTPSRDTPQSVTSPSASRKINNNNSSSSSSRNSISKPTTEPQASPVPRRKPAPAPSSAPRGNRAAQLRAAQKVNSPK